jgi:hypothetical protein
MLRAAAIRTSRSGSSSAAVSAVAADAGPMSPRRKAAVARRQPARAPAITSSSEATVPSRSK